MPKSKRWLDNLDAYERASREWRKDAKRYVDRYRLERSNVQGQSSSTRRPTFNLLWSTVQTVKPTLFSRTPEIIAERRHRDKDPIGRIASEVLQRAANEETERNGFKDAMEAVVLDVLLVARGVPWVRFEADELAEVEVSPDPVSGMPMTDDGMPAPLEEVTEKNGRFMWKREGMTNERTVIDYVHWDDFAHSPERNWADVMRRGWVGRRISLTKREGKERFGPMFDKVPMTMASRTSETMTQRERDGSKNKYGAVWEIWDAVSKKRIFVAKGYQDTLEETDDPYGLENFFPCPRPAYATLTNEDLFPIPDYKQILEPGRRA